MSRVLVTALAWVLVVACGGAQRPAALTRETLVAIKIEGTTAIPVEDIAPGLAIERARGQRAVDAYQLSTDVDRVKAAYLKLGYFEVKVTAHIELKDFAQTVVFTVVEGPRSRLRVEIVGLPPAVPLARARALIPLPDGAPFDYEIYDDAKEPMVKLLEDAGYANVEIEAIVLADRAQHVATARFVITPNERATIGAITIAGAGELEDAVRGRLAFAQGDVYTAKALAASQRAIYDLNRFTTVRVEPDRSQGAVVPIKVTVVRVSSGEVRYGGGVGLDPIVYELRGRFGVGVMPDAFPLWQVGLDLRPALTLARDDTSQLAGQIRATAFAERSELFRPYLKLQTELSYDYVIYEGYTTRGPRARVGLESRLGVDWLRARIGWLIEYQTFDSVDVAEPVASQIGLAEPQRRGAYELSIVADTRDNKLDVRRGWYATVQAAIGTPYALGAKSYQRLVPELRFYHPLGPIVFALRARVGVMLGTVPVTERFFSGGTTTQRGFAERRLSPYAATTDGDSVVIGGVGLVETSVEMRFPIVELGGIPFVGALFLDGGDVVTDLDALPVLDQQYATGFGLYIKLFGLKVGASIGQRLNRRSPDDGFWANRSFHIAVGDTF